MSTDVFPHHNPNPNRTKVDLPMITQDTNDGVLIETDGRGRTNLSKLSKNGRFLGSVKEDGTIILEPATIVTAAQERLMRNPHAIDAIVEGDAAEDNPVKISHAD
ncbi:antitoxin from a toxin-antitoxin system [Gordonia phage Zirinka]|uniref:Uncharacterized protein n=20 Tax=Caudoviricetes TaxID=2731619 RepID=A0A4Y5TYH0_9CAUD|nr:antitoxin from a toxin-antitoxin system [Gordonia phage Zirinka]YP_009301403.1 antitoxin from a toxin-antitoxin system [Gordonia phage Kita]YP_009303031.1 antitoxin from a toxin-antitoxin system [Gordonia phage SoilAssassin]YP_009595794.1 antitoxin from a toxin-antitoxin system [Gordonia phage Attis]YP_010653072.1 antitoxin from a toxin-antitoxin system [Gordonia phage Polly]YP_010653463.1 antitoxin from a toxin-antitoxin system [Gordonia phage Matteo]YP_010653609.1 antitoxin from a toxin-